MAALRDRSSVLASLALVVVLALFALAACGEDDAAGEAPPIQVSMLVQVSEDDARWFRDVEVAHGANAYELTEQVTGGEVEDTWYPAFRTHFVDSLMGVENENPNYWLIYVWNESQDAWEPLPVGADLYSLKDGHIMAWSYTDTSLDTKLLPVMP